MKLKGWVTPLCGEAVQALLDGTLHTYFDEKLKCELLKGFYVNRYGIIVEFL